MAERATPQYTGKQKRNFDITDASGVKIPDGQFVDTNYIKMSDTYSEVIEADVNNTLYDVSGDPNVISIGDLITLMGNQLYNKRGGDEKFSDISFYEEEIDTTGFEKIEDKIGDESRDAVKAKYILGDGILTADLGLANEPITYLDGDTLLDVSDTTDGSGLFTFPDTVKVANIKIPSTGDIFYLQEGTGDTIADSVNGRIAKMSSTPTFVDINTVKSQADQIGYTVSNGENYAWDEALTDVIWENVIIPNLTKNLSVAYYSETPLIPADIKALKDASCTFYVEANRATGTSKGINSPFTNPMVDLIGSNDMDLIGFAETTSDGYVDISLPNTTTQTFMKTDGTNSYGFVTNVPELDPTGTEDFAICGVFLTPSALDSGYLICKSEITGSTIQYGIFVQSIGRIDVNIGGTSYLATSNGSIVTDTLYEYRMKRISGTLTFELNEVETYNQPNTTSLVSQPNLRRFARSNNSAGTLHTAFLDINDGYLAFFYNGSEGLDSSLIDDACELVKAPFLVLQPI